MPNESRPFYELLGQHSIFCGFKVMPDGDDPKKFKKLPVGIDGVHGIESGADKSRLGNLEQIKQIGFEHLGVSFTGPITGMAGKQLICVDLDWKRAPDGQPHSTQKALMDYFDRQGFYYEMSISGHGAHYWGFADIDQIPGSKVTLSKDHEIEIFSGAGSGKRMNVLITDVSIKGDLSIICLADIFKELGIECTSKVEENRPITKKLASTNKVRNNQIVDALNHIDNECDYDDWLAVGMALKVELGDDGFEVWDQWSQKSSKYDATHMGAKWKSFKKNGVGVGTLIMMARNGGFDAILEPSVPVNIHFDKIIDKKPVVKKVTGARDEESVKHATQLIKNAQNYDELIGNVAPAIKKLTGITMMDVHSLAYLFKAEAKRMGHTLPVGEIRLLLTTEELAQSEEQEVIRHKELLSGISKTHPLIKNWVFVRSRDVFYNKYTAEEISIRGANLSFRTDTPLDFEGNEIEPAKYFTDNGGALVTDVQYVPSAWSDTEEGIFFWHEGSYYLNSYQGHLVPVSGNANSLEAQMAKDHILGMFSDKKDGENFLQWCAYCVQNPGKRILWAPIVIGIEGDGKSSIGRMLAAAMGYRNVKNIGLNEIYSAFTGWAEGACVGVIEEIRITGHSRHDVMNSLKPFLTNQRVSVVKKGRDGRDVLNTMNYLCFSNHMDALVLEKGDRRWGVFNTQFSDRDSLLAVRDSQYWLKLYHVINNCPGDVRAMFMSVDTFTFDPNKAPEYSLAKAAMVEASRSDDELNVMYVISEGGYLCNSQVVNPSYVNHYLKTSGLRTITTKQIAKILRKNGFYEFGVIYISSKTHRVYVSLDYIKEVYESLGKTIDLKDPPKTTDNLNALEIVKKLITSSNYVDFLM